MLYSLVTLACLGVLSFAQDSNGCKGTENTQPIVTDSPTFVAQHPNGKLFYIDNENVNPRLYIAHLYGTPYEMGHAYGSLLRQQITLLVNETYQYLYDEIGQYIGFLPPEEQQIIEEKGVEYFLDYVYALALPHIPLRYTEEMKGVSDGSGLSFEDISRLAMIPEAIKASCSIVGAWNSAVTNANNNRLVQLRALDWSTDGPFQQYPVVLVYHPTEENSYDFAVLTWTGLIGAITGYSSSNVGICEKVDLEYEGKDSRRGIPFDFLLRDILQYDTNKDDAIQRMQNADRTCSIWAGVGDSHSNAMNIMTYTYESVTVYDDGTTSPINPNDSAHPQLHDVVYVDKHKQPSSDPCLGNLLSEQYGNIDAKWLFQSGSAKLQTGDMHIAVYDYLNNFMYVSNADIYPGKNSNVTQVMAYDKAFIRLNMTRLFEEIL